MAQQIITFDPDVGVPMGVNLTMSLVLISTPLSRLELLLVQV